VRLGAITVTSSRPDAFDAAQTAVLQLLAGLVTAATIGSRAISELRRMSRQGASTPMASETGFHRLFFENPTPMWVLDAETQSFLAVNDAAVDKYGYSAEEFAGLAIAAIRPDAAHFAADLDRARAGGRRSAPAITCRTSASSMSKSPPFPSSSRVVPRSSRSSTM
jgi:PAS domain-containing protein